MHFLKGTFRKVQTIAFQFAKGLGVDGRFKYANINLKWRSAGILKVCLFANLTLFAVIMQIKKNYRKTLKIVLRSAHLPKGEIGAIYTDPIIKLTLVQNQYISVHNFRNASFIRV